MLEKFVKAYALSIADGMGVELTKELLKKIVNDIVADEELWEFMDSKVMDHITDYIKVW